MHLKVDEPKSLKDPQVKEERLAAIHETHVFDLTRFVERIRLEKGLTEEVPYFDPDDGGVEAECLFLLEAPGPKAVASGFVSRNNPDQTAKNFFLLNRDAGIPRRATVTWNIVPWYLGDGSEIRPAKKADIAEARPYLAGLIDLLPHLRVVVLVGRKAQRAANSIEILTPNATVLQMLHPSPLVVNTDPRNRPKMLETMRSIRVLLEQSQV